MRMKEKELSPMRDVDEGYVNSASVALSLN